MGDKTSIAVAPIVAACGVPFAKMSGRGLAHTGGTLDKLESIPGFRVELTTEEFIAQVKEVGLAIIGQTGDLVPADKKLYALRDVTGTVDSIQLIAASIMSKKIAAGAEAIVLDVKVGDGAFMKTIEDARVLAETMVELGRRAGREVVCLLTDMDQPLGHAVGNALEIREAIATIRGDGPPDFTELVLAAVSRLLSVSDLGIDVDGGPRAARSRRLRDGSATAAYERWISAQGGDPDELRLPTAPVVLPVEAPADGWVDRLGAIAVGRAALHLGAGRAAAGDTIDHSVGIVLRASAATASAPATCSPRSTRRTPPPPKPRPRNYSARTSSPTRSRAAPARSSAKLFARGCTRVSGGCPPWLHLPHRPKEDPKDRSTRQLGTAPLRGQPLPG